MTKSRFSAFALSSTTAFALVACSDDSATTDSPTDAATVTTTAEAAAPTPQESEQETIAELGDDPVFSAIDAVLAQHADGVIVDVDREDSTQLFDIDVVVGNEVIELEVDATTGDIREDEREGDDDDI
ncbi:hypothetical protein ACXZ66_00950 [Corynebacterium sp. S7]